MKMASMKTYKELIKLKTYEERIKYLLTNDKVGDLKFGHARYLNQSFYSSTEWKRLRHKIITRDECCDLGLRERPIYDKPIVHHIIPITIDDICDADCLIYDPNNLITVSDQTHRLIHYGNTNKNIPTFSERKPNDTVPWK